MEDPDRSFRLWFLNCFERLEGKKNILTFAASPPETFLIFFVFKLDIFLKHGRCVIIWKSKAVNSMSSNSFKYVMCYSGGKLQPPSDGLRRGKYCFSSLLTRQYIPKTANVRYCSTETLILQKHISLPFIYPLEHPISRVFPSYY